MALNCFSPQDDLDFREIVQMTPKQLYITMEMMLKRHYDNVFVEDDYLYAVGTIPVAVVAHMDTVFSSPPADWSIFHDAVNGVYWSPYGLGADDRAGVFAIIKLLHEGYRPSVILTLGEEKGGIGARHLIENHPAAESNLYFLVELDRQGYNDCVFYQCDNPEFLEFIERFGYTTDFGTFTDISFICPTWGIAGVNLSVGYYNEHSEAEFLFEAILNRTIFLTGKILEAAATLDKPFEYIPLVSSTLLDKNFIDKFWAYPMEDDEEEDDGNGFKFDPRAV
jgi:hypothetical protein